MHLSELLAEHFHHPRHHGSFPADAENIVTSCIDSKTTGRMLMLQLKIVADKIEDMRFKAHGCPYTIATASYLTELCCGKTLVEVEKINREQLAKDLNLPTSRYHCAVIAEDALKTALKRKQI